LCEWLEDECIAKHSILVPVSSQVCYDLMAVLRSV
jgi:hypothetical protein